jgi:hypothetical protein
MIAQVCGGGKRKYCVDWPSLRHQSLYKDADGSRAQHPSPKLPYAGHGVASLVYSGCS